MCKSCELRFCGASVKRKSLKFENVFSSFLRSFEKVFGIFLIFVLLKKMTLCVCLFVCLTLWVGLPGAILEVGMRN